MLNGMGLGFVFSAKDLASGAIKDLERNFMSLDKKVGLGSERIKSSFKQMGVGLSLMAVGSAMVAGGFALANMAGAFEQAITGLGVASGATSEELSLLRDAAINAGIATQYSPTEATAGLRELAQAGFSARESLGLLTPVLDLAAGSMGELSPQQAAGVATHALKAFGLTAADAGLTVDRLVLSMNLFSLNAADLPVALSGGVRGAQALNQSLSETLIALGLVKNIVPGLQRASGAVAASMERMADPDVQKALKGIGVEVTNSQRRFRNFLDILGDMAPKLDRMTEAQRSAYLMQTFGRQAMTGVQAVLTQVSNGIRTTTGATVKGADAIGYLRNQFENASGAAADFRSRMLDTFEGQKKLLKGSTATLATLLGEPFTQIFKPIVSIVVQVINAVLGVIQQIPMPVKKAFATFFLGVGAVIALVGSIIAAKAAIALLVVGIKAAGVTLGGVLSVLAPAIAIFVALGIAVAGFVLAFRQNVGGIADFAARAWEKIKLAFRGLVQLFQQGGFSGAVREELGRAENQGLKGFLIQIYLWGNRIKQFFAGIGEGFSKGIEACRPYIDKFLEALGKLGGALGFLGEQDGPAAAAGKFAAFGAAGEKVGRFLSGVFGVLVRAITAVVEVGIGLASAFGFIRERAGFLWQSISLLVGKLGETFNALFGVGNRVQAGSSGWETFGKVIGWVIGLLVDLIGVAVSSLSSVVGAVSGVIGVVKGWFGSWMDMITGAMDLFAGILTGNWRRAWDGIKLITYGYINGLLTMVLELVGGIAGAIDGLANLFGIDTKWQSGLRAFAAEARSSLAHGMGVQDLVFNPVAAPASPHAASASPPTPTAPMPSVAAMSAAAPVAVPAGPISAPPPPGPTVIQLQVDGQTLATAVHGASRDNAARSFSPVPVY